MQPRDGQHDPGQDDPNAPPELLEPRELLGPPEWLRLVLRRREDGNYLLVRKVSGASPTLLSTWPPHVTEGLQQGLASLVRTHLGVDAVEAPELAETKWPARMQHPYTGGRSMGVMRAVAFEVSGEPQTDALYASVESLDAEAAEQALSTDLERAIFRDGVALLG